MNVSRAKVLPARTRVRAGGWLAASALALSFAYTDVAWAQNAPVDLSPPTRSQSDTSDRPAMERSSPRPAPNRPPATRGEQGRDATPGAPVLGDAVESQSLGAVNPDVAGVLREDQGGFGNAMWEGTERRLIETFLPRLPVTTPSPAMRGLMRRLLLTGADVPEGGQAGSLVALRANLLSAMGDFQGVNALLDAVPGYDGSPELLRVELDIRLLTGDVARACDMAHTYIDQQTSVYWQKAFNFCQAVEGQREAAMLGLSLLEELGGNDPVFSRLVSAIANGTEVPAIESLSDPTPLHLAMARVAKAELPADVIASNRPGVLRAIAISPNADAELRLEAAERAEAAGALPTDALRQLYASISFTDEELQNPLTVAASRTGPMSRALLYRATLEQTVPVAQAEALSRALDLARSSGRFASAARAFLPQLSRLEAGEDLLWIAPEAVRAFLITGRAQSAQPWFELLKKAADRDPAMARALETVMPVARLSGFEIADGWTTDRLNDWWLAVQDDPDARFKAATLTAALDALGEYIPGEMWANLSDGPSHQSLRAPHASLWFLLEGAATRARVGEAVMLSLVSLGEGGPQRAEPIILHRVLRAVRYVGLRDEARAMALEAIVAAGL